MAEQTPPGTQTIRIPFLEVPHFRDTTAGKDNRFVNGLFEPIKNSIKNKLDYFFIKRPGLSQNIQPSGTSGTGRGCYVWKSNIYSVVGTKIYKNSTDLGVTLTTVTGLCKFEETRPGAATEYLCVNDGVKLYCIATGGAVTTVTVNFPANTRDLEYMDQYMCVLDTKANLWTSSADDPTTWSTSTFITAQMLNGMGIGLAKVKNMMVVLTDRHHQLFYDAANISGSPFSNAEQYMRRIGCDSNDSICQIEDKTFWLGNGYNGGYTVWLMEGTDAAKQIGTPTIDRMISLEGTSLSACRAIAFRHAGHTFYALTLSRANRTFVYDPDIDLWVEWTDTTGAASWPIVAIAEYQEGVIAQHATNGWIYNIRSDVYQDDSVNFPVLARTPRVDLDTIKRKFVDRLDLVADRQTSSENVTISYSDDDYQTFSTGRTFDISITRAFGRTWGNFRRRSWQVQYTGNQPYRCYGFEMIVTVED